MEKEETLSGGMYVQCRDPSRVDIALGGGLRGLCCEQDFGQLFAIFLILQKLILVYLFS